MARKTSFRRSPLRYAALLAALCLCVGACSGFTQKIKRRFGGKLTFDLTIDSRLNHDFPLAVDLVVVYDKGLYGDLQKMSAADWFAQREQQKLDHEPDRLEVSSWEWVPPSCPRCPDPGAQTVEYRLGAQGGVLFANYFNPGVHRIVIEPLEAFTLALGEDKAERLAATKKKSKKSKKDDGKGEAS